MGDNAVGYTLGDAARATGLNKTAILKAIRSGKGSRVKHKHGQWRIEPCELHRVYPEQKALPLEARVVDLEADRNAKERFQMTERDFGMIAAPVGIASMYAWRGIWGAIATAGFICFLLVGVLLWATSSVKGTPSYASNSSLAVHHVEPVW
jgi:hypothetical protein